MEESTWVATATALISAVADLLWPIVAFIAIFVFRRDASKLLSRLRRGKIFGQEIELDEQINEVRSSVAKNAESLLSAPVQEGSPSSITATQSEDFESDDLRFDHPSPNLALMALTRVLERELTSLIASMGKYPRGKQLGLPASMQILHANRTISASTLNSVQQFWNVRNRVIHDQWEVDQREVVRVMDVGRELLNLIRLIPHEKHRISSEPITLYEDEACTKQMSGVKGIEVESIDAKTGESKIKRVFPVPASSSYKIGDFVSWEWDVGTKYGPAYRKNSQGIHSIKVWDSSGTFVGRRIADIV